MHRYNITTPDGLTLSIVAKDDAQAKDKAWHRLSDGVPFLHYGPGNLKVSKLESVDAGPRMLFPEYLAGG